MGSNEQLQLLTDPVMSRRARHTEMVRLICLIYIKSKCSQHRALFFKVHPWVVRPERKMRPVQKLGWRWPLGRGTGVYVSMVAAGVLMRFPFLTRVVVTQVLTT